METWQIGVAIVSVDIVSIRRMLKPSVSHNLTVAKLGHSKKSEFLLSTNRRKSLSQHCWPENG